ncbi:glycoside hydrolase family 2 protein [Hortaea werneckii]|nr:glycoside hydrolase family 2 protein [Hortaea werneckii]
MSLAEVNAFPGYLPDWSNLNVIQRNAVPPRAQFYNYPSEEAALTFAKSEADYESLNGDWKFHYDESPFTAPSWDTADPTTWESIEVPGHWQRQGYGRPHYTNIHYPFPVSPPNVSYMNPTGSYWREFEVPEAWDGQQIYLRYEGVDSAFTVYVNGEDVGYSQGARNPAEFDITEYLKPGQNNSLGTRVYQWSDGSYLEDQDQWWLSGIFRDVYLTPFANTSIADYQVLTDVADDFKSAGLKFNISTMSGHGPVKVKLLSPDGDVLGTYEGSSSGDVSMEVSGEDFHLWSAESPTLYTAILSAGDQYISQKVGFTRIEMKGPNMLVNGQPIIIYGVNRHEHNAHSGRTVPYEAMRADLIKMKQSNINTIRVAHQPHHPDFWDLADELGFYLIGEADLECHGFNDINDTDYGAAQWTSNNTDWEAAYLDRAEQVVDRYRNHPSVIIWSLGNECYYGQNHATMYDWIKKTDPSRLIHYEPDQNATSTDMYSHMYPSLEDMEEQISEHTDKFYMLCEFAHAMGNGPGGLLEYIHKFRTEPLIQGGLIWEWNNHGLLTEENGTEYYGYGGDFGDYPNDGPFLMDGMTSADHSSTPALAEYAWHIQPVEVKLSNDSTQMMVRNWYDFLDLSHLQASYYLVRDGNVSAPTDIDISAAAGETATLPLPVNRNQLDTEAWLTVEFALKEDTSWASAGHVVAWNQLYLEGLMAGHHNNEMHHDSWAMAGGQSEANVTQHDNFLNVSSGGSTFSFDMVRGNVTWSANGVDMFHRGPELYFYRAMTQNDNGESGDALDWEPAWVHSMRPQVRDVFWKDTGDALEIRYNVRVAPAVLEWGAEADLSYTIPHGQEALNIHAQGGFVGNNTPEVIPRIGLLTVLNRDLDDVTWFGRGPGENYPDSKSSQRFGEYQASVSDLWTYYDYPQENGARGDVRRVQFAHPEANVSLEARMDGEPFSFTAKHYSDYDLDDAGHPYELSELDMTFMNLDYDSHGLGSATVGPRPFEPYKCYTRPFDFTFQLRLT